MLLSKHFAPWLATDDSFLEAFANKLLGNSEAALSILAAVVDRIPSPSSDWVNSHSLGDSDSENSQDEDLKPSADPPVNDKGHEGLAYYASPTGDLFDMRVTPLPSSSSPLDEVLRGSSRDVSNHTSQNIPTLSFSLFTRDGSLGSKITVPTANTVFQIGSPSLAFISRLVRRSTALEVSARNELPSQSAQVSIACHMPLDSRRMEKVNDTICGTKLALPLHPLVPMQSIKTTMGNIISKVSPNRVDRSEDPQPGIVVPASQEVESAVSRYTDLDCTGGLHFPVWALILPSQMFQRDRSRDFAHRLLQLWNAAKTEMHEAGRFHRLPANLIWKGARLHQVLSGGGGWGQKAGLISLAPERDLDRDGQQAHFDPDQDTKASRDAILQSVATEGDQVLFFAAPPMPPREGVSSKPAPKAQTHSLPEEHLDSFEFGTIPSSIDELAPTTDQQEPADGSSKIETFLNHFGVLSEGGMALFRPPIREQPLPVHTRLDVPYSRFSYQRARRSTIRKKEYI